MVRAYTPRLLDNPIFIQYTTRIGKVILFSITKVMDNLYQILTRQKQERDQLLAKNYLQRVKLAQAVKSLSAPLIKVITGPRRSGKYVFALSLLKNTNFAYLNFEDEELLKIKNYDHLWQALNSIYPQAHYFLFDEIQNLDRWEIWLNRLHRTGHNLIITGSNSRLLSKELATSLTGRHLDLEILPFSYGEYRQVKGEATPLNNYLEQGGFPEPTFFDLDRASYLQTLVEAILFKDVAKRYALRFTPQLADLLNYLMANGTQEFTYNRLARNLNFQSTTTLQKYLGYLEEAYLVFTLNRFSFKFKQQLKAPKKIYVVDNGLMRLKSVLPDWGKLLENAVFLDLVRHGYRPNQNLFYYQTKNNRQVDFVLKKDLRIEQLIQVCYDPSSSETREREMKALKEAGQELNCANLELVTAENFSHFTSRLPLLARMR
jgi:hypothetical protein